MAKKKATEKVKAFQFVFEPQGLQRLLDMGPKKVLFTVSIESVETKEGKMVGALRIDASAIKPKSKKLGDGDVPGCPIPPCTTQD
ncbi:hypothetical protein WSM22_25490 [Cytophagales bacterium WSM2-2]|nr:hypothetical protein WSM22_25490 [Cytophagales bacterium WSM2-2]